MRGGNLKIKKAGGGLGGRAPRLPPNAFSSRLSLLLLLLSVLLLLLLFVVGVVVVVVVVVVFSGERGQP